MKNIKHILIIAIFCLVFNSFSYSQLIKGEIIGGANTTQVDGDQIYGYFKWGFNVGASAIYSFDKVVKYALMVEDPTFGRFELSSNMVVEWKTKGRWYQTKPQFVINHLLAKGAYDDAEAQEG